MAHYAKIVDGVVTNVIVAEQDFINTQSGTWVQTSYNTYGGQHLLGGTPLRKNYAGIGYTYDSTKDAFYSPKPYPSWSLNESSCVWEAPVADPTPPSRFGWDRRGLALHDWNEDTRSWVEVPDKKRIT